MTQRPGSRRALALMAGTVLSWGCHHEEILRFAEEPARSWDVAWLQPLDELGRPAQKAIRFEADAAGLDLEEEAAGFVVVGLVLDDLLPRLAVRVDRQALTRAELVPRLTPRDRDGAVDRWTEDRAWLELDVLPELPYFELIGPRSFDPEQVISSSTSLGLIARLPLSADACGPVRTVDRTPVSEVSTAELLGRHVVEIYPLSRDVLFGAVDAVFENERFAQPSALVRLVPNGRLTEADRFALPGPVLPNATGHLINDLLVRPRARSSTTTSIFALQIDGRASENQQESRLLGLDLPHEGSWDSLPLTTIRTMGPLAGSYEQAAQGMAESELGDLLILGGRNAQTAPTPIPVGFVAISPANSSSIAFTTHDVVFSGNLNGDILYRAAALPSDPARPGRSIFALGARRGEILIVAYDAERNELDPMLERFVPPPDITVKVGVGYEFLHVIPRENGYELWAVGRQGLLVRRTVDGRWQILTELIEELGLDDEHAGPCMPLAYPLGRDVHNVARGRDTALLTLQHCAGAILVRFDEDDEPMCATAVLPPDRDELAVSEEDDFDAVTAVEGGYYMVRRTRLELSFVPEETP